VETCGQAPVQQAREWQAPERRHEHNHSQAFSNLTRCCQIASFKCKCDQVVDCLHTNDQKPRRPDETENHGTPLPQEITQ